jgi:hypothetical protein
MDHSKLRPIEAFPVNLGGRDVICLRDPAHLTDDAVFVPRETLFILAHFDRKHSILDIQEAHTRQYGQLIYRDAIKALIAKLDEHLLLDNEHFKAHTQVLLEAFRKSAVRHAAHVDTAYVADPITLEAQLAGYFADSAGPRTAAAIAIAGSGQGILSPHIDPRRGGPCFAWAYESIRQVTADLFIVTMPATAGTVLKYDQAVEPATEAMVSYASVVFH